MKSPPSLLIDFHLNSVLLDIRIATTACFLGPFAPPFQGRSLKAQSLGKTLAVRFLYKKKVLQEAMEGNPVHLFYLF